jgi:predicted transcriptional regulator
LIDKLPPRERELFERLYAAGEATAAELQSSLDGGVSNSAVRVMLRRLEAKGFVRHREDEGRFIYTPALPESRIKQSAIRQFVQTYFGGSPAGAAAALIGMSENVSPAELAQLEQMIAQARREDSQ